MGVDGFSGDMGGDSFRQGLLKVGGSMVYIGGSVEREGVAFDLSGDGLPVGIPVCPGVVMDKFGRRVRTGSVGWMDIVGNGEQDGVMVTADGIQDFGGDAPKEVRGGYDDVRGGVANGSGVPGQWDNVASEGKKELMPPPEFGRGAGVDVQVGGEYIGRKCAV